MNLIDINLVVKIRLNWAIKTGVFVKSEELNLTK